MDASRGGGLLTVTCATELSTCLMIAELEFGSALGVSDILGDLSRSIHTYIPFQSVAAADVRNFRQSQPVLGQVDSGGHAGRWIRSPAIGSN